MSFFIPLILFFLLYTWLARRDFLLALGFFAMALPAYLVRFNLGPLPSTALEGMFVIVFLSWLGQKRFRLSAIKESVMRAADTVFFKPGLLLLGAATISIFFASDTQAALGIWKAYFIEPFLLYILLLDVCRTEKDWKYLFIGLGGAVIFLTLVAIIQRITGWWSPTWEWTLPASRRVTSVFTSPNALGLFVGPVTVLYTGWAWVKSKISIDPRLRLFQSLVIISGIVSIILSVSRGAMIATAVGLVLLAGTFWSRKKILVIATAALCIFLLLPATRSALTNLASFQVESGQSRLALYEGTGQLLRAHPIAGLGLANFAEAYEAARPESFTEKLIYPHNIFLNFWSETGLLGLAAVVWIMVLIFQQSLRNRGLAFVLCTALAVILVHGLADVPYFKNDLAMLTWIVLAALADFDQTGFRRKSDFAQTGIRQGSDRDQT